MPNTINNETIARCLSCGEEHPIADMTEVSGGYVCDSCLDEHYSQCDYCGDWVLRDELESVNRGMYYYCLSCLEDHAVQCDDCGEYFTGNRMTFLRSWGHNLDICDGCSSDYRPCDDCGAIVHENDCHWDDDDYPHCADCYNRNHANPGIRNYSYKPAPDFAYRGREDAGSVLTFGTELEVDVVDGIDYQDAEETARDVTHLGEGRLYCKHDGSLDEGFEIVSHPASLAYHMYQFRWANIMRTVSKAGFRSHETETCGLHIHVGRQQLGQTEEARRVAVGNTVILAQVLQNELTKFSRRKADRLARWAAFGSMPLSGVAYTDSDLTRLALYTRNGGRYQAVNLTNDSTVEFRIFRGTLKRDTLIAALQLVSNLCQYAMTHTPTECLNATYVDIVNVKPWDELVSYSRNKRLITATTVAEAV